MVILRGIFLQPHSSPSREMKMYQPKVCLVWIEKLRYNYIGLPFLNLCVEDICVWILPFIPNLPFIWTIFITELWIVMPKLSPHYKHSMQGGGQNKNTSSQGKKCPLCRMKSHHGLFMIFHIIFLFTLLFKICIFLDRATHADHKILE